MSEPGEPLTIKLFSKEDHVLRLAELRALKTWFISLILSAIKQIGDRKRCYFIKKESETVSGYDHTRRPVPKY